MRVGTLPDVEARLVVAAEERLGVRFTHRELLLQALTHRSYLNEPGGWLTPSNERLEFLGDSALGFLVARFVFDHFPDAPEGELTAHRAALIRTTTLADWARVLDLGTFLRLGQGEVAAGPVRDSILADAFEAILAAILIDQGLPAVRTFLGSLLDQSADEIVNQSATRNHKGLLQEAVQDREHMTPIYRTVAVEGPDHDSIFTVEVVAGERVLGQGTGRSKQAAQQEAARQALLAYQDNAEDEG
jgi:ribonuclease-3